MALNKYLCTHPALHDEIKGWISIVLGLKDYNNDDNEVDDADVPSSAVIHEALGLENAKISTYVNNTSYCQKHWNGSWQYIGGCRRAEDIQEMDFPAEPDSAGWFQLGHAPDTYHTWALAINNGSAVLPDWMSSSSKQTVHPHPFSIHEHCIFPQRWYPPYSIIQTLCAWSTSVLISCNWTILVCGMPPDRSWNAGCMDTSQRSNLEWCSSNVPGHLKHFLTPWMTIRCLYVYPSLMLGCVTYS